MKTMIKSDTLRICVIGNCHAGSLKLGWDHIKECHTEINITFFAANNSRLEVLTVENNKLVATDKGLRNTLANTSGGHEEIDLSIFDLCLVYGLNLAFPYELGTTKNSIFYSKAACQCAFQDYVNNALSIQTFRKIRSFSDIPVYIGHNPLRQWASNSPLQQAIKYSDFIQEINAVLASDNVILLTQPEETITEGIYTKVEYGSGAILFFKDGNPITKIASKKDRIHMNDLFGKIYLEYFLKKYLHYHIENSRFDMINHEGREFLWTKF